MKVLFLGKPDSPLIPWLREFGDEVVHFSDRLTAQSPVLQGCDFLVSYNYRYIISGEVLDYFSQRAINLHIALLPWNRGADPNLWSFYEGSPPGVTIHYIDVGLDTGDIIYQREISFPRESASLSSTYSVLHQELQQLFREHWPEIRDGSCPRHRQPAHYGSYHKTKDKLPYEAGISGGWETSVAELEAYGRQKGLRKLP